MKLREWSLRRWLLVIAAIILLPLIGLRLHLKWRVHRAVAELRADGRPTTWKELERYDNVLPEEENAGRKLTNVFRQLPQHSLAQSNIPVVGLALTPPPGQPWPEPMRIATKEYLDSLQDGLEMLYAALDSSECRYVRDFNPSSGLPLVQIKVATAKLTLECYYALEQGDWQRAARANRAQFQLADTLQADPSWIGQLVRNALAAMAVESCQRLLGYEGADHGSRDVLQTAVGNSIRHTSLLPAVLGERVRYLEWTRPGGEFLTLDFDADYEAGKWSEYWEQFKTLLYRMSGLADQDVLWFLDHSRKLEASLGEDLEAHQNLVDEWQNHRPERQGMRFAFWSKQFIENNDRVITKQIEMHAKLRAAYTALAVAQYRLQHDGTLPASLDELVPEFLETMPIEPQSGKPFELIITADGYGIGRGSPVFSVKLNRDR